MNDATPPQRPQVVKRVVRKTVVRTSPGSAASSFDPTKRTARRATTETPERREPVAREQRETDAAPAETTGHLAPVPTTTAVIEAPQQAASVPRPRGPRVSLRDRVVDGGYWIVDRFHDGRYWVGDRVDDVHDRLDAWDAPAWPQHRVVPVVGLLAGLLGVALGASALAAFSSMRDRTAGGGWGMVAFVAIAVCVGLLAKRVLRMFQIKSAGVVVLLGIALTVIGMLFFVAGKDPSFWTAVWVPVLAAIGFALGHRLVEMAEDEVEDGALTA